MATAAHTTNVVRLPTAARRKPKQPGVRARRELMKHIAKLPVEYIPHYKREMDRRRNKIAHIERTPALLIATCVFGALPEKERERVFNIGELYT